MLMKVYRNAKVRKANGVGTMGPPPERCVPTFISFITKSRSAVYAQSKGVPGFPGEA